MATTKALPSSALLVSGEGIVHPTTRVIHVKMIYQIVR